MAKSEKDKKRLMRFYNALIKKHGTDGPQGLSWNSKFTQEIRFLILSQICSLEGKSILDMGCGFGDLYGFLKERVKDFEYTGIDIHPEMIQSAKKKYPEAEFLELNFKDYEGPKYDIIFASGALSFKVPDYKEFYFSIIKKMFEYSKEAVAFNMLDVRQHINDKDFAAYSLPEVYDFCKLLTDKISIRQDYLSYDFTFYLYH